MSQGHLGVNIGTECFTDLDYADDMALLVESCGDVVNSLEKMVQEASKFGLEISWSKTKIQPISVQGALPDHVLVAGNQMELVCGFCYFGRWWQQPGGTSVGGHCTRLLEQPPARDLEVRHPHRHEAPPVQGEHTPV